MSRRRHLRIGPEHAATELDRLPGGSEPVRQACRSQADAAPLRLPVQVGAKKADDATDDTFADGMDVMAVLVSAAMSGGDTTTTDGPGFVEGRAAALDSHGIANTCDDPHDAWRYLWVGDSALRRLDVAEGVSEETPTQRDRWMLRRHRVLRWSALSVVDSQQAGSAVAAPGDGAGGPD